jgi:isoleucyl-tRNA synthetase
VRKAYDDFDFKRISRRWQFHANIELSAFYFDIRKDALYCDAPSSLRRRASLTVIRPIFDCVVTWLAPMLPFTMEEAWLSPSRMPNPCTSNSFPRSPAHGATRRWPPCGRRSAGAPRRHRRAGNRAPRKAHRLAEIAHLGLKPVKALTRPSASMM